MRRMWNLGELQWSLAGWTPYVWRQQQSIESGVSLNAEVLSIPTTVPGSVQGTLRQAGIIPDWNVALQAREAEWVENRHWIYTARLPQIDTSDGQTVRLRALGLDYKGWILLNGTTIARFSGSLLPHVVELPLRPGENTLQIVFDSPPRWLGQIGYTSEMTEFKERFNYFWDWTSRLVQTGIWDDLLLEVTDGQEIEDVHYTPEAHPRTGRGSLAVRGTVSGHAARSVELILERNGVTVEAVHLPVEVFTTGTTLRDLPVEFWWPNGAGEQPLYTVRCHLLDAGGTVLDTRTDRIGFKTVRWDPCQDAPASADPWICVVNDRPIFLQGVNWTPILPNFADVQDSQYRQLLHTYRDLGCNCLRVWGGAFLEKTIFYDLCDQLGLLVWQEFPLSSSGLDNWPPEDEDVVAEMAAIATSYVRRRRNHVSLLLWCGGNELQGPTEDPTTRHKPATLAHPMLARLASVVAGLDPGRRFVPTSPSGPSFGGEETRFGAGVHWDVHGPWHAKGNLDEEWTRYWTLDDSLFRSEVGVSSASDAQLIRAFRGDLPEMPATRENPLWRRTSWWIEWPAFLAEMGREPVSLEEYVAWSQERQARALSIAAAATRGRFPRCGGFLIWMGHDSFPCTANTSIIDFQHRLKPAALAVAAIFRRPIPPSAPRPEALSSGPE